MSVTKRLTMASAAAAVVIILTGEAYQQATLAYSAGRLAMDALAEMRQANGR